MVLYRHSASRDLPSFSTTIQIWFHESQHFRGFPRAAKAKVRKLGQKPREGVAQDGERHEAGEARMFQLPSVEMPGQEGQLRHVRQGQSLDLLANR